MQRKRLHLVFWIGLAVFILASECVDWIFVYHLRYGSHETVVGSDMSEEVLIEIESRWPAGGYDDWSFYKLFWTATPDNFDDSSLDIVREQMPEWEFRIKPSIDDDIKKAFREIAKKSAYDRGFNDALEIWHRVRMEWWTAEEHEKIPDSGGVCYGQFKVMTYDDKKKVLRRMCGVEKMEVD